jgi:hypothetical protein
MIVLEVRCDDCDRPGEWLVVTPRDKTAHVMRRKLHELGWRQENAADYCPRCVAERTKKERT